MSDILNEEPVRRAKRATRDAARTAKATAAAIAKDAKKTAGIVTNEAVGFGRRSRGAVSAGATVLAQDAQTVRSAAEDGAELAEDRLRASLEAIQRASEDIGRWAGARAVEAKDQATAMVQERPLGTVASIFAVGALLGIVAGLALRD